MDKRKENGGAREGAGRKSKAEEQNLIEKLTPLEPKAFDALTEAIEEKRDWAIKLYFNYMYGMPNKTITLEGGEKPIQIDFTD